ncbi:MAG: MFS transporter, partial [Gammaproteobacteria bacterium]|nr:MFS transporter [Gammaproteobacteria bacterium]
MDTDTRLQKYVLLMVLLNAFTTPMMLSAVNVALPHIARDLDMTAVQLTWIPMAYLMASAMFVLIFGRLADIYGRKRIFLIGTVSVILTSSLAAFSTSDVFILIARFLQGVSAAMLYATQVAIITSVFPKEKRGHMIGFTVSAIYLGLTVGPMLGGYLIDEFNWRAGFVFHIPLALLVILIALTRVKGEWSSDHPGSIDIPGSLLYIATLGFLCYGVSAIPGIQGVLCIFLSLVGFWLFFRLQHKSGSPVLDVSLFYTNRVFSFSCIASAILYTATFANVVLISLYLQYLQNMSAAGAGMVMMIQPLIMALFSPLAGRLSDRIQPRLIATLGLFTSMIGLLVLAGMTAESNIKTVILALALTGLGFALFSSPNVNAIMSSVERKFYGSATGVLATMRIVGQLFSMILVTTVFSFFLGSSLITEENYDLLQRAISVTFCIASAICIPGILFSH